MSQVFSQQMFGRDNRIMDGAKLDLSNPKATVILPLVPGTSVGITALTSPFLTITPAPPVGATLIDIAFNKQAPGLFLAGPVAGPQAIPTFRHISVSDIAGIGGTFQPLNSQLTAISLGLWPGATSITTLGTIATGMWQATPIGAIYGGTGQNTYVLGDTLYASAANTLSRLAGNITATRNFLRQTGTGAVSAAPAWDTLLITDLITPNALGWLHNDGSGGLAWSTPALAAHDILSATHTDTVAASVVLGDVIFGNATPKWTKLAGNTTLVRQFLRQVGTGLISADPAWDTVTKTDVGLSAVTNNAQALAGAVGSSLLTMNTSRMLGRTTALVGAIEEIQISTGLNLAAGILTATGSGGTVTSVAAGTGLTATPSPIVGAGTLAVAGALSTLYSLADAAGWLHSNGSNVFAWSTPSYSDVGAAPAFVSGTANFVWATPNGVAGVPSLRALVAADIPALSYLAGVTSDSPLTGAGTAGSHLTFSAQTAAYVLAGPATGGAVAPTFRALVSTDIPALSYDALGAAAAITPTTLGLVIGTNTQAHSGKLDTFAALADAAGWLHSNGGGVYAWSTPTYSDVGAAPAFVSGSANYVWATPNGAPGVPSLRALVASDIPSLSYLAAITSDSPLTGSGTAGSHLTFSVQTAATVFAGPATGGAVVPAFRALVATDIPSLAYIAAIVSDSPLTGSGTAGSHLSMGTQADHTVLAGPSTGGPLAPAFRVLALADLPAIALDDLSDVVITTPVVNQILAYNGADWINAASPANPSAGPGVVFYVDSTAYGTGGLLAQLTTAPLGGGENIDTQTVNNSTALLSAHTSTAPIGDVQIDPGEWSFDIWAAVSLTSGTSYVVASVLKRMVGAGTLAISGAGTSRTATITAGTPFLLADANADMKLSGWLETPTQTFQITGFTGTNQVTVAIPGAYINESGVAYAVHRWLFNASTPALASTTVAEYAVESVQPAFTGIGATDALSIFFFAYRPVAANRDVSFYHNGTQHYSHVHSPIILRHNQLAGLQGGAANQYYHLSSAAYTIATQAATALVSGYLTFGDFATFSGKQAAYANLTTIGALANAAGWLHNDGAGVFAYSTPSKSDVGLSNVTNDAQTKASIVPNTAPAAGQILVGNAGGTAYAPVTMGTDATITSAGALTIANAAVTLAKMANMATASLIYRKTAGAGAPEVNTLATLKTDLAFAVGDLAAIANNTVLGNTSGGAAAPSALTAINVANYTATGVAALTTAAESWIGPSSTAGVYFKGGNVGIGTAIPNARLEVYGGVNDDLAVASVGSTVNTGHWVGMYLGWINGGAGYHKGLIGFIPRDGSLRGDMFFALNNVPSSDNATSVDAIMLLQSGGNVGIGTTVPVAKLQIGDNSAAALGLRIAATGVNWDEATDASGNLYFGNGGGTALTILKINLNVGIGTTTPGSKLSIVGLPTSSAGLSAGDIWVDTTGGLNILKIK